MCWLGVTVGCSGIWLGSRDEIGCLARRCGLGMLGGCSSEEKIGVVWTHGKEV